MTDSSEKRQVSSNEKRYDWHTDGMWCIETGKWVSWSDYERLQRHKAALLKLAREGLDIQSAATLVMWQKRLEFCIANEPPAHETPACAVLQAAEELLEVLPVPNDYYGDEAQTLREALDNARKSSPETRTGWLARVPSMAGGSGDWPSQLSDSRGSVHYCPGVVGSNIR
jgi:hypothetical protein